MPIAKLIQPRIESLGPFAVRRVLPASEQLMVGPFIFIDQGGPAQIPNTPRSGVGEHPHAGLSTFTYLLAGRGYHRDSAGNEAAISAGDIALMTAGSGITHEERPDPQDNSPVLDVYFVQMWLALPDEREDCDPSFELHHKDTLPCITAAFGEVRVGMGTAWGETAPTNCLVDSVFVDLMLRPAGKTTLAVGSAQLAVYLLEGAAEIDGQRIFAHTLAVLETASQSVIASTEGCRAVLFGGERFANKRYLSGNFVASSREKIDLWRRQYAAGQFPSISTTK